MVATPRLRSLSGALVLWAGGLTAPVASAAVPACAVESADVLGGAVDDIDGDQVSDLVLGDPVVAAVGRHDGQVRVVLSTGPTQTLTMQPARLRSPGGQFGWALAVADVDFDGCSGGASPRLGQPDR